MGLTNPGSEWAVPHIVGHLLASGVAPAIFWAEETPKEAPSLPWKMGTCCHTCDSKFLFSPAETAAPRWRPRRSRARTRPPDPPTDLRCRQVPQVARARTRP